MKKTLTIITVTFLISHSAASQDCPNGYTKKREIVYSCVPNGTPGMPIAGGGGGIENLLKALDYFVTNIDNNQIINLRSGAPQDVLMGLNMLETMNSNNQSIMDNVNIELSPDVNTTTEFSFDETLNQINQINFSIETLENSNRLQRKSGRLLQEFQRYRLNQESQGF